jgi:hypothetical protein
MFDHAAALRHVALLIALLRRLFACVAWGKKSGPPPAPLRACLEQTEAALARTMRAGLAELGEAFPDCADHELIAWFLRTHGDGRARKHAAAARTGGAPAGDHVIAPIAAAPTPSAWAPVLRSARAPP